MLRKPYIFPSYLVLYLTAVLFFSVKSFSISFLALSIAISALILGWRFTKVRYFLLAIVVIIFACWQTSIPAIPNTKSYQGVVVAEPQRYPSSQQLIIENKDDVRFLVYSPIFPKYQIGDQLAFNGRVMPARDNEQQSQNIGFLLLNKIDYIVESAKVDYLGEMQRRDKINYYYQIRRYLIKVRERYENILLRLMPSPYNGLAIGILLGNRDYLTQSIESIFIVTGIVHIMALSGYNISIIATSLSKVSGGRHVRATGLLSLIAIWLFVAGTGLTASVVRAAIMGSAIIVAKIVGRQNDSIVSILLTASVMVAFNPYLLRYDIGFQLSFAAMAGMLFLAPIISKPLRYLGKYFSEILSATIAAQILTLPLLSYYFGSVSVVSIVANALVLPIIPTVMGLSFGLATIGMVSVWLAQKLAYIFWMMLAYIVEIASVLASVSWSQYRYQMTVATMIGIYLLIIEIVFLVNKRSENVS